MVSIVGLIGVVLYFFIAAQGAFYHIGFGKAMFHIPAEGFIQLRKAVDPVVRRKLKGLYLSALAIMFTWLVLTDKSGGFLSYGPVLIAFLLLVTDLVLILKCSEPVNELINSDLLNTQQGYSNARKEWMKFIFIRGYLSVSGFVILLAHLIFQNKF